MKFTCTHRIAASINQNAASPFGPGRVRAFAGSNQHRIIFWVPVQADAKASWTRPQLQQAAAVQRLHHQGAAAGGWRFACRWKVRAQATAKEKGETSNTIDFSLAHLILIQLWELGSAAIRVKAVFVIATVITSAIFHRISLYRTFVLLTHWFQHDFSITIIIKALGNIRAWYRWKVEVTWREIWCCGTE